MHAVVETLAFLRSAAKAGMTEPERDAVVALIAADPTLGEVIVGSGGCRKLRVAGRGKGKSGGYRVVTYYAGESIPVFALAVLSKGDAENFGQSQVNAMAKAVSTIADGIK